MCINMELNYITYIYMISKLFYAIATEYFPILKP